MREVCLLVWLFAGLLDEETRAHCCHGGCVAEERQRGYRN